MSIRIVMLGDIVGTAGRLALAQCMPALRERYQPNLVIANAENAANGSGLTPALHSKLAAMGIDGMTLGDHVYKKKEIMRTLEEDPTLIRAANLPASAAGRGWMRLTPTTSVAAGGERGPSVYVITLLGRVFMNLPVNHPFEVIEQVLSQLPSRESIVLVEMHAEATSEKVAMGWYLNGRVAAVLGTHTHIPTADARILPAEPQHGRPGGSPTLGAAGGTAYITDLGMTGPYDSILGRRIDRVLHHMTTSMHAPYDVAEGNPRVCGVSIDVNETSLRATAIERIDMPADVTKPPFTSG
ncbi:YmdB family metallophosphoesterase [Phycisphaerales bacterium AB-hyl4]|uniref:YmdB family metallophosphoesterase n=1 Tax=Natronomicrosphaera hydrolytica TaxID=3242702 RepID=A0ABV4UA39_9BACT